MSGPLEPIPPGVVITDPEVLAMRRDAYLQGVAAQVEAGRHQVQAVFGSTPEEAFAYTVGLHSIHGCPELWVGTLGPEQAADMLNGMAHLIAEHGSEAVVEGGLVGVVLSEEKWEWFDQFQLRGPVDPASIEVGVAYAVARVVSVGPPTAVEVWQVCWPDREGRFPDDPTYDAAAFPQRLLPLAEAGS